jgi:hypothetical protein
MKKNENRQNQKGKRPVNKTCNNISAQALVRPPSDLPDAFWRRLGNKIHTFLHLSLGRDNTLEIQGCLALLITMVSYLMQCVDIEVVCVANDELN